jgi:crotonobetainyl-CoA:carnitine CoA-transferase CaiB-like acyl-CoA transferase
MGCADSEVTRSGNEHRKFIPTNVYPTRDGFVYLAIGSDVQWQRLTAIPQFAGVANAVRITNEGRGQQRDTIYRDMAAATMRYDSEALLRDLAAATIPATRILDIAQVRELMQRQGKLTRTTLPDASTLRLPPMAVDLAGARTELAFPPQYGAHTHSVLSEAGYSAGDIAALVAQGVLA